MKKSKKKSPQILIAMGSESDRPVMEAAKQALDSLDVASEMRILSAHRTPKEVAEAAENAHEDGFQVIIAGAGGAAHLPGMMAAHSPLPVIGVPVPQGPLQGHDALLSIVQMPKGVPVATVAIGNAWNAGILAAQIVAAQDDKLRQRLIEYKNTMRKKVLSKK